MGYLGLDGSPIEEDNLLQRLFWPGDHPGEADTLGQQAFWICLAIGVAGFCGLLLKGHPISAVLSLAFYLLGGIGVREHSQPAAIFVAIVYSLDSLVALRMGNIPGALQIITTLLLIANIRGTWIASKWAAAGSPEPMPERLASTWSDKLVDQLAARVWPRARIPFFCIAILYSVVAVFGTVLVTIFTPAQLQKSQSLRTAPSQPPSQTVTLPTSSR